MIKIIISIFLFPISAFCSEGFTFYSLIESYVGIPDHIATFIFINLILCIIGLLYRYRLSISKNVLNWDKNITIRNMIDLYTQFIISQAISVMGEERAKKYFSFLATTFIVILLSNLVGIVPGFLPPTEHISTTLALGLFSFIYYNTKGVWENGIINYLKHFAGPLWYMSILIFPIELISHIFRPLTLALRLRGNIMGDHMVLSVFYDLAPWGVPIFFLLFGILVCVVQAYVFTILSMVYISLATSHD